MQQERERSQKGMMAVVDAGVSAGGFWLLLRIVIRIGRDWGRDCRRRRKGMRMKLEVLLVAVDFSEVTLSVYDAAVELASRIGARVRLVNVTEPELDYVGMSPPQAFSTADEIITRGALAALKAGEEVFNLRAVRVETVHRLGGIVPTLLAEVESAGADLVVLGSHGHGAMYSLLVGSVAEGMIKHAKVPVLVVPDFRKGQSKESDSEKETP